MIQQFDTTIGECFYIGNESVSCILCVHCGQIELLHFGAPLSPEDAEALTLPEGLGWGCSVLYKQADSSVCLDTRALAWSESGLGDYRETPVILSQNGQPVVPDFVFSSSQILSELPAYSFPMLHAHNGAETLELVLTANSALLTEKTTLSLY